MTNHSTWLPFLYPRVSNVRSQRGYPPFPLFDWLWLWSRKFFDRWESRILPMWPKNWSTWNFVNVTKSRNASDRCHGKENVTHECHPKSFLQLYNPKSSWFTIWVVSWGPNIEYLTFQATVSVVPLMSFYPVLLVFVETAWSVMIFLLLLLVCGFLMFI